MIDKDKVLKDKGYLHYAITDETTGKQAICPDCKIPLRFHHGFLGYESLFCPKCGFFADVHGETGKDKNYIKQER